MKLRRLDLLRYGHLADTALEFPPGPCLYVIHGANEAGKSTTLSAIADALFGFPHRSAFDFIPSTAPLQIGFTLADDAGADASFFRRKGRGDTLLDPAREKLPESTLRRFLGGADRALFERGFGLNGARLREGARELQASGGEAGGSLLASTGLLNLRAVLDKLDTQAKAVHGDGRGKRELAQALDRYEAARRAAEAAAIPPADWKRQQATRAEAETALAAVQARLRDLGTERARLERARRVAPLLKALTDARAALAEVADAPSLPADIETRRETAETTRRTALADAAREAANAARLTAEQAAEPPDTAILAVQDAIDTLESPRTIAEQAALDLPEVEASAARAEAAIQAALADLPPGLTPEEAAAALPSAGRRQRLQALLTEHARLADRAASTATALTEAQGKHAAAAHALAAAPPPPDPSPLRLAITEIRAEGRLDDDCASAAAALASAEAATATALAALPLWPHGLTALAACPLPLQSDRQAARAALDATARTAALAAEALAQADAEQATLEAERAGLATGGPVPTPAAIAGARATRDALWLQIRSRDAAPSPATADQFEAAIETADRLADQGATQAQRVAAYLACEARLAERAAARPRIATAADTAAQAHAGAEAAWQALWSACRLTPQAPAAMEDWVQARARVLEHAATAAQAATAHAHLAIRLTRARAALPPCDDPSLAAALRAAELRCRAEEAALAAHTALATARTAAAEPLPSLTAAASTASAALATWHTTWATALEGFPPAPDTSIPALTAALAAWNRVAEIAAAWQADRQRIGHMRHAIESFAAGLYRLLTALGAPATDAPPATTARQLARRLAEARTNATRAADLTQRIAAHQAHATEAGRRLAGAQAELAALRALAGAADDEALSRAIARARQREAAERALATHTSSLAAQGDGQDEAALRAEAEGTTPDASAVRIEEIKRETETLGSQSEHHTAARTTAEIALATMQSGRDAATHAQQAADALADARGHAEHYARLHVARELLRAGIERFRRDRQDPLLRAAGAHFALLTAGRYTHLTAEEGEKGEFALHAIRADDSSCPMHALSEGTRDQLYLALRIAGVQAHIAQGLKLPFIADDLLVHFDDSRAAAALALLAQLGQQTQVILFTHHAHIAALAAAQPGAAVQHLG